VRKIDGVPNTTIICVYALWTNHKSTREWAITFCRKQTST